jgi:formyl-CoA transferase
MSHILEGIKVIDAASYLAGPAAATVMADFGADVIKIEPPSGDGLRLVSAGYRTDYNWQMVSRNKRDLCLDLKQEAARKVLHTLIDSADVLILNFREDQIRQFELDYDALLARNPRLIYALVTGYGTVGPDRNRRGFDVTAWWARSGISALLKPFGHAPVFSGGGIGDHATALGLLSAIMMGLYHREKTGQGRQVATSLVASGCYANGMMLQGMIAGHDREDMLNDQEGQRSAMATVYRTRDDEYLMLSITNPDKEWPLFAECLGHPEWCDEFPDGKAVLGNREAVTALIATELGRRTLANVCEVLDTKNMPYASVEHLRDVVRDAHLIENGVIKPTGSEDADYQWMVANPISIADEQHKDPVMAPDIGAHSDELLREYGYGDADIAQLQQQGAVVQAAD